MRSRCGVWSETRGPGHHHGGQRAHSVAIQAGCYFHHRCCPGAQRRLDVCVASPMQQQLEETQHRRRLIANCPTSGIESQTCATRAFTIDLLSGRLTGDHTLPSLERGSTQQTSHPAATGNGQQMSAKSL